MFPGDVFWPSGSILFWPFPPPPRPPPCPGAGSGDGDSVGGSQPCSRNGVGQQVSWPRHSPSPFPAIVPPFLAGFWKAAAAFPSVGKQRGGPCPWGFLPVGKRPLLFPQVHFGSRSSQGCWAERTRTEKQLMVAVGVLLAVLAACLMGLIFQYRASKSSHPVGILPLPSGWVAEGFPVMGWLGSGWDAQLHPSPHSGILQEGCLGVGWDAWEQNRWSPACLVPG